MTFETSSNVLFSFHSALFHYLNSSSSPSQSSSLTIKSVLLCLKMCILISDLTSLRGRNTVLSNAYHSMLSGEKCCEELEKALTEQ